MSPLAAVGLWRPALRNLRAKKLVIPCAGDRQCSFFVGEILLDDVAPSALDDPRFHCAIALGLGAAKALGKSRWWGLRDELDQLVGNRDGRGRERDVCNREETGCEMRHTIMQLRAHEDGLALLAVLAKELHIAEAIPHGDFEDF